MRTLALLVLSLGVIASSGASALSQVDDLRARLRGGATDEVISQLEAELTNVEFEQRDLLELLAMAYQQKGHLAKARDAYQRYLRRFPDVPEAARVQQRLTAMLTATLPGRPDSRNASATTEQEPAAWQARTSWSVFSFVNRSQQSVDIPNRDAASSSDQRLQLVSNLDSRTSGSAAGVPLTMRAQLGFTSAIRDGFVETDPRIRRLWAQVGDQRNIRIGRQRTRDLGLFGTLDGISGGWQGGERWRVQGAAGMPLAFGELQPDTQHHAFSVGAALDAFDGLSLSAYFTNDAVSGLTNRRALGGEVRFRSTRWELFSNTDYDILHQVLNLATARVNWRPSPVLQTYVTFDYRLSPFAATRNALIGQPTDELEELRRRGVSESILQRLAARHSVKVWTGTAGATFAGVENWRLSGRLTYGDQSGTRGVSELRDPADELLLREIPGFDGAGTRTEAWGQLVRERIFGQLSVGASGRYAHRQTGSEALGTVFANWRHSSGFNVRPQVRLLDSDQEFSTRRSLLFDLRASLQSNTGSSVSMDVSYSIDRIEQTVADIQARRLSVFVGYVLQF